MYKKLISFLMVAGTVIMVAALAGCPEVTLTAPTTKAFDWHQADAKGQKLGSVAFTVMGDEEATVAYTFDVAAGSAVSVGVIPKTSLVIETSGDLVVNTPIPAGKLVATGTRAFDYASCRR